MQSGNLMLLFGEHFSISWWIKCMVFLSCMRACFVCCYTMEGEGEGVGVGVEGVGGGEGD